MYLQFSVAASSIQYAISYSLPSSFTFPLLNSKRYMLSESNNVTNAYLYRSEPFLSLNIFLVVNSASYWVNMSLNLDTLKNASQKFPQVLYRRVERFSIVVVFRIYSTLERTFIGQSRINPFFIHCIPFCNDQSVMKIH